jgi:hypothetical protein
MIRIGITKEFSLEVAPVMMEQLDSIFEKGVHASFTDTGVFFSIEPRRLLSRILREPYWQTPESLRFYRWVLVVGQHQTVSKEFGLQQLFCMSPFGKLLIFPYINDNQSTPYDYVPHVVFGRHGDLEKVEAGQSSTQERVLERIRQMGLIEDDYVWTPGEDPSGDLPDPCIPW